MPGLPRRLRIRDRASGGALGPVEPQLEESFVDDVGADLAFAALDPFLDLG
jgi:hypothetical protein